MTGFCMMQDFDCRHDSVPAALIRQARSRERLLPHLPHTLRPLFCTAAYLTPELSEERDLCKLTLHGTWLPLSIPLGTPVDQIDTALHALLFQRKVKPFFLSFDTVMRFYPQDVTERLLRIPSARFQFRYHTLSDPAFCRLLTTLCDREISVVFGTELNAPEKLGFTDLAYDLGQAEKQLSAQAYHRLLSRIPRL